MATWQEFTEAAPALADAVRARLTAHRHHVLATLRADGSPRVSGTEVETFRGLLVLGSMPGARKVWDLHRDPRYALHSNPGHHTMEGGDAKISGRARELTGEEKRAILDSYPENPATTHRSSNSASTTSCSPPSRTTACTSTSGVPAPTS